MAATVENSLFSKLTFIERISETVPVISESIETFKGFQAKVVEKGSFLQLDIFKSTLETAKGLTATVTAKAYDVTVPYHGKAATVMEQVDGYAHRKLDEAEEKYPKVFEITSKEVGEAIQERRKTLTDLAAKALEPEFRTSALTKLDDKAAPVVTYLESTVASRLNVKTGPHAEGVRSYQRAIALSRGVTENIQARSSHQLNHVREHNALADRAIGTAETLTALVSASVPPAFERVSSILTQFSGELVKLRESTLSLRENLAERVKAAPIPAPARKAYDDLLVLVDARLKPLIEEFREIVAAEATAAEKLLRVKERLTEEAAPLLSTIKETSLELLSRGKEAVVILKDGGSA